MVKHKICAQKILDSIKRCTPHAVRGLTKAAVLSRDEESTACIGLTALHSKIVDFKEWEVGYAAECEEPTPEES
jgi:hypothetical protein